jgi:diaminohydroxyphosphoribosylaminopyrimidine deaminase/5-amino-6-(5-phosphoribosylamino)uracil reductase
LGLAGADHAFMARALVLARRGLYTTFPNPRVGCVLVRDGRIVGEGWHERAGGPHAEVMAIERAGDLAAGSTCYVTLEPCAHHGRTPPCTGALIRAKVARVVAAMTDPNPRTNGRGAEELRRAGIEVEVGLLADQAAALNRGFVRRMQTGRPFVRCKLAVSLDGRTAAADGDARWITGEAARLDVQRLRAESGAILTGADTVLADDPQLTVRVPGLRAEQPLRVVLDRRLRVPREARMLKEPGRTLILTLNSDPGTRQALEAAGAEVAVLEGPARGFLRRALEFVAGRDINEVLVEAGPRLSGAFLAAGLVDELVVYQAAVLLGHRGMPMFRLPRAARMADRLKLACVGQRRVGADWRLTFVPAGV